MDPKAIIAALPMIRRVWAVLPPQLRVPVLVVAAAVGVWQFVAGRKKDGAAAASDRYVAEIGSAPPPPVR